tara:strand:+ start:256 stop:576 length:321 start_codon:yes stop_codon:yes gene_type:complete
LQYPKNHQKSQKDRQNLHRRKDLLKDLSGPREPPKRLKQNRKRKSEKRLDLHNNRSAEEGVLFEKESNWVRTQEGRKDSKLRKKLEEMFEEELDKLSEIEPREESF